MSKAIKIKQPTKNCQINVDMQKKRINKKIGAKKLSHFQLNKKKPF